MYAIKPGLIMLILVLVAVLFVTRRVTSRRLGSLDIGIIDKYLVIGLFLRILWMLIVLLLQDNMTFLVYDDESYYNYAMQMFSKVTSENGYYIFLEWIYKLFGKSSLNGRVFNLAISLMTIYPLASLECNIDENTDYKAAKFFACSPFMIFISFFEIKDLILLFTFTASYAVIKEFQLSKAKSLIPLLLVLCLASEQIRTGMGIVPIAIFVISIVKRGVGANKAQRILSVIVIGAVVIGTALLLGQDYIGEQTLRVEKYQTWILTQFSDQSIYNRFVITSIADVWKLPFCFVLYTIQPINALDGSRRFFMEWGMFAKMIDVPVLLMSIWWLLRYIKKEKLNSLLFILPYIFVSGINLTNARQGFFLYPIMYVMCFAGYNSTGFYRGNNRLRQIFDRRSTVQMMFIFLYIVWFMIVFTRI